MTPATPPAAFDFEPPAPTGHPWLAWSVVALMVAMLFVVRAFVPDRGKGAAELQRIVLEQQLKYMVGAGQMVTPDQRKQLYEQLTTLLKGSLSDRLRLAVLAGELIGPAQALAELEEVQRRLEQADDPQRKNLGRLRAALERLYRDYEAGKWDALSLDAADRQLLVDELGWFGQLALAPAAGPDRDARQQVLAPAQRILVVFLAGFTAFVMVGLAGLVGLVAVVIMLCGGWVRAAVADQTGRGAVYAETFALWMFLYLMLSVAAQFVLGDRVGLLAPATAMLVSLSALAWPVLRGVPWELVCQDVGLLRGRGILVEAVAGLATYAMAIPMMVVGLLLTLLLMWIQSVVAPGAGLDPADAPSHPIVEVLLHSGWWGRVQLLVLASVIAPLVEETMFRGVLYRHLREATARFGFIGSILASGLLVSFVFAVVHPQGPLAVPALMSLALAFTLAREWRGSLIAAMVAHGINNGVVMALLIFIAAG
ncbi:MAG: type II CAAX endopeptidase family protein [Pirellulales bacterium]